MQVKDKYPDDVEVETVYSGFLGFGHKEDTIKPPNIAVDDKVLKQPQYQPMEVVDQIMVIFAGNTGYLDSVGVRDVPRWEKAFLQYMRDNKSGLRSQIIEKKELNEDLENQLRAAIDEFNTVDKNRNK